MSFYTRLYPSDPGTALVHASFIVPTPASLLAPLFPSTPTSSQENREFLPTAWPQAAPESSLLRDRVRNLFLKTCSGRGEGKLPSSYLLEGPLFSCSSLTDEETEAQKEKGFAEGHGLIQARARWIICGYQPASPLLQSLPLSEFSWHNCCTSLFSFLIS